MKDYIELTDCPKCARPAMTLTDAMMMLPIRENLSRPSVSCQSCSVTLEPSNLSVLSFFMSTVGGLIAALAALYYYPMPVSDKPMANFGWAAAVGGVTAVLLSLPMLFQQGFRKRDTSFSRRRR